MALKTSGWDISTRGILSVFHLDYDVQIELCQSEAFNAYLLAQDLAKYLNGMEVAPAWFPYLKRTRKYLLEVPGVQLLILPRGRTKRGREYHSSREFDDAVEELFAALRERRDRERRRIRRQAVRKINRKEL